MESIIGSSRTASKTAGFKGLEKDVITAYCASNCGQKKSVGLWTGLESTCRDTLALGSLHRVYVQPEHGRQIVSVTYGLRYAWTSCIFINDWGHLDEYIVSDHRFKKHGFR